MAKHRIASKPAQQKARPDDPGEIRLRLRGLARLIGMAVDGTPHTDPINGEAAYFIERALQDMAEQLSRA